ncbi:MAG TPA: transporter [Lachnospiraceae bacterium]|nr:transporter [Lachnospiraceae bacterium]
MKKYVKVLLKKSSSGLELFIAGVLCIAILFFSLRLTGSVFHFPNFQQFDTFEELLSNAFSLVIGIELIRMLCEHSPGTIFEVLVFAIARQVVISHGHAIDNLIGVAAIAILFATRKYLFCEFDEAERIVFRASLQVSLVNKIVHTHIPYNDNETLGDILLHKLEKDGIEVGVGACAYFSDFGLRIAKMHEGKVSRIEVIRSIR